MKKLVLIILAVLAGIFFIVSIIQFQHISTTGKSIVNDDKKTNADERSDADNQGAKNADNQNAGGDSKNAGGSNRNSELPNTDIGCRQKQIAYSIKKVLRSSVCSGWLTGKCIDKTVNCSIEVQNLDSEVSGKFEIEFEFFAEGEKIDSLVFSYLLNPLDIKLFEAVIQITGENADKEIFCPYTTLSIPKKKVC